MIGDVQCHFITRNLTIPYWFTGNTRWITGRARNRRGFHAFRFLFSDLLAFSLSGLLVECSDRSSPAHLHVRLYILQSLHYLLSCLSSPKSLFKSSIPSARFLTASSLRHSFIHSHPMRFRSLQAAAYFLLTRKVCKAMQDAFQFACKCERVRKALFEYFWKRQFSFCA